MEDENIEIFGCGICSSIAESFNLPVEEVRNECYIHQWTGYINMYGKKCDPLFAFMVNKGWHSIISCLIADLKCMGWDGNIGDVKEKFGGLRFYIGGGTEEMLNRISEAEDLSMKTCCLCGAPATKSSNSSRRWITICDKCNI